MTDKEPDFKVIGRTTRKEIQTMILYSVIVSTESKELLRFYYEGKKYPENKKNEIVVMLEDTSKVNKATIFLGLEQVPKLIQLLRKVLVYHNYKLNRK